MSGTADFLRAHPVDPGRYRRTLADAARRVAAGEDLRFAVREVLDELALLPDARARARSIADEPISVDARTDALLAAVAEHVAVRDGTDVPRWALAPGRFLERMWFPSPVPGFRATAIRESPAAFRRRGIFVAAGALHRV